jgi:putative aldouronate transport system permease protein
MPMVEDSRWWPITRVVFHAILMIFALLCIIPMVAVVSVSFSDEIEVVKKGYGLVPRGPTTNAYRFVLRYPNQILSAYRVSVIVAVLGMFLSTLVMSMGAYPLARPDFRYGNAINFYVFFTMLFSGGLVPSYILVTRYLHLRNTIWVQILPMMVGAWYVFLLRTYMKQIPMSLVESAKIDGASEYRIYLSIVVPMSKPALATIALLTALSYWNSWYLALLFIEKESLVPLQYWLMRVMTTISFLTQQVTGQNAGMRDMANQGVLPTESARMAMAVLAAGPMLFVFPFFQRYFVRGIKIGAVKG